MSTDSETYPARKTPLTFSTSVGLARVEEMTPEITPQMTLINNVSSAIRKDMM